MSNYIIIDLEWNQSVSNDKNDEIMPFEIIEIGAVKLDSNLRKKGTYQKLIQPVKYRKIAPIVTNMTKIHMSDLKYEKKFPYVIKQFLKWCGDDYIFCTYGSQDLTELQRNMEYHNIEIPWKYPFKYIDIQRVLGIDYPDSGDQIALEKAVEYFKLKQGNVYHRALGDALYTSEILKYLKEESLDKYTSLDHYCIPESLSKYQSVDLGTHIESLSCLFKDRDEIISEAKNRMILCPICKSKCRKKIQWFSDGTKHSCVAICNEHGYIEGHIIFKKKKYGFMYGIKRTQIIDEERLNYIIDRKKNIVNKRKNKQN